MSTDCRITAIAWERVHLTLTVQLPVPSDRADDVQFMIVDVERAFPVPTRRIGTGRYQLSLNVTNFRDRSQVPNGTWRFVAYIGGSEGPTAGYDLGDLEQLAQDSRTFVYASNRVAYMVVFDISEDDERPVFLMSSTYQMFRNPKRPANAPKPPLPNRILQRVLPRTRRVQAGEPVVQDCSADEVAQGQPDSVRLRGARQHRRQPLALSRADDRAQPRRARYKFRYSFRMPHSGTKRTTLRAIYLLATSDIVLDR